MTHTEWLDLGDEYGWKPPAPAPAFWLLPPMCWIRALWNAWQVERWYSIGPGTIGIRTGYDSWVLQGMWRGWV